MVDNNTAAYKQERYHFPVHNLSQNIMEIMVSNHLVNNSLMLGTEAAGTSVILLKNAAILQTRVVQIFNGKCPPPKHKIQLNTTANLAEL